MFYFSVGASALVLLFANISAARSPRGQLGKVCWISGIAFVFSLGFLCVAFPTLMLNFSLMTIVALICQWTRAHSRVFLTMSVAVTIFSYGIVGFLTISEMKKYEALREEFPYESMAERLAYEGRSKKRGVDPKSDKRKEPEAWARLEEKFDQPNTFRAHYLASLHERSVSRFVNSPGFGVTRQLFMYPTKEKLEIPAIEPISFPLGNGNDFSADSFVGDRGKSFSFGPDNRDENGEGKAFRELHENSFVDFVNMGGFGYIKDREHVAGFQPHQFSKMPKIETQEAVRWQVTHLELVSLLKHEKPMVYLSDHLPRMDELRHAKVRPLDAFEKTALAGLERGEDLKVSSTPDRIRMFGSIRAVKQCLKCHDAERGDLLGAFSYKLRRIGR